MDSKPSTENKYRLSKRQQLPFVESASSLCTKGVSRRVEISRLDLQPAFAVWHWIQYEQPRAHKIFYRMGQRALAYATDTILVDGNAQKKPVILPHGT